MLRPLNSELARTWMVLSFCAVAMVGSIEAQDVVCSGGFGSFKSTFATGVTVSVDARRNTEFAGRICEARISWGKKDLLVEPNAWQVDVDAMGIDLGLGALVVAFQLRKSDVDRLVKYEIYSLNEPPRLLRTITGGSDYSAADTDLDGRIEIWTNDAEVINGFENIPLNALDFAPPVVLRFEQKQLIDVSSEFRSDFDRQIATLRAQLNDQQLSEFKHSDGALSNTSSLPLDQAHSLSTTKIKALEMVWCYLYSDREPQAWKALAEMWPESDFDRIRAAILNVRTKGIRSQVNGVSHESSPYKFKRKHAMIYDRIADTDPDKSNELGWAYANGMSGPGKDKHTFEADTYPIPILMRRPPPPDATRAALNTEMTVNLVIDAAGKVQSAKAEGKQEKDLLDATAGWKFVPAFKDGRPVASRLQIGVTPLQ
jgi:hypothetical protein